MTNEFPSSQPAPEPMHTPGPWDVLARGAHGGLKIVAGSMLVATVARANLDFSFNARLIAATPQQHDALLAVLYAPGFASLDDATKNAVRAAIAKATGAQA